MKRLAALLAALFTTACAPSDPPLTPLIVAIRAADINAARSLLEGGAHPDKPGGINRWPPLLHAVHKRQSAAVRLLLDHRANPNAAPASGYTALMMAAAYGDAETVRLLLSRGANPRLRTRSGQTALHFAVGGNLDLDHFTLTDCQTETVRLLTAADPELRLGPSFLDQVPAWLARAGGCREVIRLAQR
ncbi:MAG: ankyrin repeat domain-containing protein [Bryobacteraceae bacterium]|nr:ankyrin repeat domain-containing protein [Bryobacteraceae bacterium]